MSSTEKNLRITTTEQVNQALDELEKADQAFKNPYLDSLLANLKGEKVLPEHQAQMTQAVQRRGEIVDDLLDTYTSSAPLEGKQRIVEVAAAAGGIDKEVDEIILSRTFRRQTSDLVRGSISLIKPQILEMSDEELFGKFLPTIGLEKIATNFNLNIMSERLSQQIVAVKLLQGRDILQS